MYEECNGAEKYYFYDSNGIISGIRYFDAKGNMTMIYVVTNALGDVIALYDKNGNAVVEYQYDAWGNIISIKNGDGTALSGDAVAWNDINPFRYRSYYYDAETGLYYLNSRYYDCETGRFLNSDDASMLGVNQDFNSFNLFVYCGNNPIVREDASGHAWETIWDIVSLGTSIAEVAANPVDPWAWAGLIGDVVDVAVPFVGGLGEAVDVVKTVSRVVDKGDDIIDAAKNMRRAADAADDIKDSTGAYVILYKQGQHYIGKGGFNRAITSATEHMSEMNKVSAIIWAPTPSKETAFVTEYLLQSIFGIKKTYEKSYNLIWSPGKKIFNTFR